MLAATHNFCYFPSSLSFFAIHKRGVINEPWNVPVGLGLSKMLKIGNTMVRIEVAIEHSVVNEDDFGERGRFKINFIPIVPRPIKKPLFGGG